jgi:D-serine deaminase-like pyridoxal phosphate-dependent protein
MKLFDIASPAVYADLDIFDRNARAIFESAREHGIGVRPHIKTHKSLFFARRQMKAGAIGITTAKLSEAEIFANAGFDDILLAFPLYGREKWLRYAMLHERIKMTTTVDSFPIAEGLSEACRCEKPMRVLVEIDGGTHRCGIAPDRVKDLASRIKGLPGIEIVGVFMYNALVYQSRNDEQRAVYARAEMEMLSKAVEELESLGIEVETVSGGNSPESRVLGNMRGLTEVRPGNGFFNDVGAVNQGYAAIGDCALRVLATVVSLPLPGRATIDAGTKTFTGDMAAGGAQGMGILPGMEDVSFVKANEEHGFLEFDPRLRAFRVGDRVTVVPNHACVLPNLCDKIYVVRGEDVVDVCPIDARGCNY